MSKRAFNPPPVLVAAMSAILTAGGIMTYDALRDPTSDARSVSTPSTVVTQMVPPRAHKGHAMAGSGGGVFTDVNARMHAAMAVPSTGDVDRDFAAGMIPHHEGAIEMAKLELKHGKDPEMRKLAQSIIDSQISEVATMKIWTLGHRADVIRARQR